MGKMKASGSKAAINNAFSLIGKSTAKEAGGVTKNSDGTEQKTHAILPTARTRKALDILTRNTPETFAEAGISLKPFLQDLFNWDGNNHVNKPLIRAFRDAINTEGKYPHAVELTGYLAALAPLLEADQLARMYSLVNTVNTAFAPTKYTMQLSERLNKVFSEFSPERRERLASSLWEQSHNGRWWNLTAGIDMEAETPQEEFEEKTAEEIFSEMRNTFENVKNNRVLNNNDVVEWNPHYQEVFAQIPMSQEIAHFSEEYSQRLSAGEFVHPDIAVYLSSLSWLSPEQRPESPVSGLLKFLIQVVELLEESNERKKPKKPKTFSDLFPSVYLQVGSYNEFPLFPNIKNLDGKTIAEGHKIQVIKNRVSLAENAKFMGNCTLSYENRFKGGEESLLLIDDGKTQHNVSIKSNGTRGWSVAEINARYNQGHNIDDTVRNEITSIVQKMPPITDEYAAFLSQVSNRETKTHVFSYSVY